MQLRCKTSQVSTVVCCEHKASMTESNSSRPWALKGWRCFSDSWKDTKIWFQTCWGVTMSILIQRKRLWSHWSSMRRLLPSFPLLPLRLFHRYITREEQPTGPCRAGWLHSNQSLQRAVSETQLPLAGHISFIARISAWSEAFILRREHLANAMGLLNPLPGSALQGGSCCSEHITALDKSHSLSTCSCIYS